jgi:hypothetical protein
MRQEVFRPDGHRDTTRVRRSVLPFLRTQNGLRRSGNSKKKAAALRFLFLTRLPNPCQARNWVTDVWAVQRGDERKKGGRRSPKVKGSTQVTQFPKPSHSFPTGLTVNPARVIFRAVLRAWRSMASFTLFVKTGEHSHNPTGKNQPFVSRAPGQLQEFFVPTCCDSTPFTRF